MICKKFHDLELSALGLGCMRLPKLSEKDSEIDEAAVERMVAYALEHGINYFDTAWGYHEGQSELVMGRVLSRYPRDRYYIATKFPGFDVKNFQRKEEIFHRQLEKLQVEYFDFYLCHNVAEKNVDAFLSEEYGLMPYLLEQKKAGRIRHLGFSTHGSLDTMRRFLEAWGHELEFCQIQLNWLDWEFQDAKAKVELISSFGLPVWVMEPVRGGRLVKLPADAAARLDDLRPGVSAAEWAFRFLQSVPQVTMILSGMSDDRQLEENIHTFETEQPLTQTEWDAVQELAGEMIARNKVPCTGCRYCMEQCPQGLTIPLLLEIYGDPLRPIDGSIPAGAVSWLEPDHRPTACIGCRACEAVCPQNIPISELMADFASKIS